MTLAGEVWPTSVLPPRAAVVVVHGFTADRHHPTVLAMAGALRDDGHAVIAFDVRGHGESSGLCTMGDLERLDVEAAVTVARDLAPHVVVVGASMGAIAALRYAVDDPDLAGVVTVSCPARWQLRTTRSAMAALLTRTRAGRAFLARRVGVRIDPVWRSPEEPEKLAARVPAPLAVVHGLADRFMPALEASRLHDAGPGHRRLDLVPRMGHAFHTDGLDTIVRAVNWCLGIVPVEA